MKPIKVSLIAWTIASVAAGTAFGQQQSKQPQHAQPMGQSSFSGGVVKNKLGKYTPMTPAQVAADRALLAEATAHRGNAERLYAEGRYKEAEQECFAAFKAVPVVQGKRPHVPFVDHLLGQIYLKAGENKEAIRWLSGASSHTASSSLNLELALAYLRDGQFDMAQRFYSDQATLQYGSPVNAAITSRDLPGTDTLEHLEASILLAQGTDVYYEDRIDEALAYYLLAAKKAPSNAQIAYRCGVILYSKHHLAEAEPFLETASRHGIGELRKDASMRLGWLKKDIARPKKQAIQQFQTAKEH